MKVISYNVNGIRAAQKKELEKWMEVEKPDVLCLQEIKALEEQVDLSRIKDLGYYTYLYPATKKGYSGVAILSKIEPKHIEYGTGIEYMDFEGRVIRADYKDLSVISVYVPSGTNMDRLDFKLQFCDDFLVYIKELKKTIPNLVICGDFNICHHPIDIHDPVRNKNVSGFLPVEREWLTSFLQECDLIDGFRHFDDRPEQYSWWSYRGNARPTNKGWRLDYNLVSGALEKNMKKAFILQEAMHSDHCPVGVEFEF